ncbi:MAG: YtrH family sporulation protein [Clostridiales bacterium]|nr:YtrH family sporulation protein [Clostridiales bacterium]MCF8023392.1 YtrH family sporulation protein [Clostridiales bacterium]
MEAFHNRLILVFCTALGMMLGASLVGSLSALLAKEPPVATMLKLAREIKIWAVAAALGGTFSLFEVLESGLFQGEIKAMIKQICYVISAITGTQFGYYLLLILIGDKV